MRLWIGVHSAFGSVVRIMMASGQVDSPRSILTPPRRCRGMRAMASYTKREQNRADVHRFLDAGLQRADKSPAT